MEGSYYQQPGHSSTPISPQTPGGGFTVNVNRKKTRKWVEAKVQNYDGDDWGADEYGGDGDEEEKREEANVAPQASYSIPDQRLPSETQYSERSSGPAAGGPPPLHVETRPQEQLPPQQHPAARSSEMSPPIVSDPSSASGQALYDQVVSPPSGSAFRDQEFPRRSVSGITRVPVAESQVGQPRASGNFEPPTQISTYGSHPGSNQDFVDPTAPPTNVAAPSAGTASPLVRPSDIYRRLEEEKEKERQSMDSARPSVDAFVPPSAEEPPTSHTQEANDADFNTAREPADRSVSISPQLPNVARMSAFGLDMFSGPGKADPMPAGIPEAYAVAKGTSDNVTAPMASAAQPAAGQRVPPAVDTSQPRVTSAYLGQLASPDFGQSPPASAKDANLQAEVGASEDQDRAVEPEQTDSAHLAANVTSEQDRIGKPHAVEVSPISEQEEDTSKALEQQAGNSEKHSSQLDSSATVPPLRTPSPRRPATLATEDAAEQAVPSGPIENKQITAVAGASAASSSPGEQSPAQEAIDSPSDYDDQSLNRHGTMSSVAHTASPVKESDLLRDEIMKSLSPATDYNQEELPFADKRRSQAPPRGNTRESTYSLSAYDSYWDDSEKTPSLPTAKMEATIPEAEEPSTQAQSEPKSLVSTPVPAPPPHTSAPGDMPPPSLHQDIEASDPAQSPGLRRKFSWEMASEEAIVPREQGKQTSQSQAPSASQASPPAATAPVPIITTTASSARTSAMSPVTAVSDAETRGFPPHDAALTSAPDSVSQMSRESNTKESEEPASVAEAPSPVSGSDNLQSTPRPEDRTSAGIAPNSAVPPPLESHPALAGSGPASSAPGNAPSQPKPSSIMPFRDIMAIQTPSQRIMKYNETRDMFSSMDSGLGTWVENMRLHHPEHANATPSFQNALTQPPGPPGAAPGQPGAQPPAQQPYYQQYLNASSPAPGGSSSSRSRLAGLPMPSQAGSAFGNSGNQIGTKSKEIMQSAGKRSKDWFSKGKSKLRGSTGDKGDTSTSPPQSKARHERRTSSFGLSRGLRSQDGPAPQASNEAISNATARQPPRLAEPSAPTSTNPTTSRETAYAGQNMSRPFPQNGAQVAAKPQPSVDDQAMDDWVVVPRQSVDQGGAVVGDARPSQPAQRSAAANEDSGVGLLAQPEPQQEPRRMPSFKGLPPIRRSSTFGLDSSRNRSESDWLSISDDEDEPPVPPLPSTVSGPVDDEKPPVEAPREVATVTATDTRPHEENVRDASADQQRAQDTSQPTEPAMHPQMVLNPGHGLQTGPWKLEESHLSEPLHTVARNRAGTDTSQPQVTYDFDKETGLSFPMPPSPTNRQPQGRHPPSTTQRYPDLFYRPGEGPPPNERADMPPQGYMPRQEPVHPRSQHSEFSIPGVSPPTEERGHQRKTSGFLKDLGNRFTKGNSKDAAKDSPGPALGRTYSLDPRGDETSLSSVATGDGQERRKKRSSFIPSLRGRASMDQSRPSRDSLSGDVPSTSQSDKDRRRSFMGAALLSRSSISAGRDEPSGSPGKTDAELMPPPKKRMPDLASRMRGQFSRPSQDRQENANKPSSMPLAGSGQVQGPSGASGPTDASNPGLSRQASTDSGAPSSFDMSPPEGPPPDEKGGKRSRRSSFSGLLSGVLGHRPGSKGRELEQQQIAPQQQISPSQVQGGGQGRLGEQASPDFQMRGARVDDDQSGRRLSQQPRPSPLSKEFPLSPTGSAPGGTPKQLPRVDATSPTPDVKQHTAEQREVLADGKGRDNARLEAQQPPFKTQTQMTPGAPQPAVMSGGNSGVDWSNVHPAMRDAVGGSTSPPTAPGAGWNYAQQQPVQVRPNPNAGQPGAWGSPPPPTGWQGDRPVGPPQPQQYPAMNTQPRYPPLGYGAQQGFAGPGPHGQQVHGAGAPGAAPTEQADAQSSRWKGLRNRVSGQNVQSPPQKPTVDRPKKEEKASSGAAKLLGAFKRSSKAPEPRPQPQSSAAVQAPMAMAQQSGSFRGYPQPPQAPGQQPAWGGQQQQMQGPPMGNPPGAHYPMARAQPGQMGGAPQQGQWSLPQQGSPPTQGTRQFSPRAPEPQYNQVPIPQGYSAVHGDGSPVPAPYNVNRTMSHPGQMNSPPQSYTGDQGFQQGYQQQQSPQYGVARRPSHEAQPPQNRFMSAGGQPVQPAAPRETNHVSYASQSTIVSAMSSGSQNQHASPPPQARGAVRGGRQSSVHERQGSQGMNGAGNNLSTGEASRTMSVSPQMTPKSKSVTGQKQQTHLAVDVDKAKQADEENIYESTPRLGKDLDSETQGSKPSDVSRSTTGEGSAVDRMASARAEADRPRAELEDTEEAHKRKMRLESQEEKIYYDPEDDREPAMSATSYPGQEWNPYGMPEYALSQED